MKEYHDKKRDAKTTVIKVGDQVLVKQKKTTVKPFYDSKPYRVISVKGTMVTAARNNKSVTRNVSKFHKIPQITSFVPREDQEIQFNGMLQKCRSGNGSAEVEMESEWNPQRVVTPMWTPMKIWNKGRSSVGVAENGESPSTCRTM